MKELANKRRVGWQRKEERVGKGEKRAGKGKKKNWQR